MLGGRYLRRHITSRRPAPHACNSPECYLISVRQKCLLGVSVTFTRPSFTLYVSFLWLFKIFTCWITSFIGLIKIILIIINTFTINKLRRCNQTTGTTIFSLMVTTEGVETGCTAINSWLMYGRSKSPRFALMRVHSLLRQLTLPLYLTIISKINSSSVCL